MPQRLIPGMVVCLWLVSARLWAETPEVTNSSFNSDGVGIHYVSHGKEQGEPVLLIHGFTLSIEAHWEPVLKELAKDYKVITLDLRGHGASEKPHDPKKYGLELVKDAVRLLDHLKFDKAHIVGYSLGGGITLQMAARYPQGVQGPHTMRHFAPPIPCLVPRGSPRRAEREGSSPGGGRQVAVKPA